MAMSPTQYRQDFIISQVAQDIAQQLEAMVADPRYITRDGYSPASDSDGSVPFVAKHIAYLSTHPKVKPSEYMANLRLMTKVRNTK